MIGCPTGRAKGRLVQDASVETDKALADTIVVVVEVSQS
jgi:hypothetical protein